MLVCLLPEKFTTLKEILMKARIVIILCICIALAASPAMAGEKKELKNQMEKASYAIGLDMGNNLKKNEIEIDPDILARAIKDVYSGNKHLMTDQEVRETLMALQKDLQAKQVERNKMIGEKNKKEGDAFLAKNKKESGVKTLPSGLQYKVITEGKGKSPKTSDTVTVNYSGTLINGTEFDSSYKRGQPATFPVSGVIKGWTEALQLMKEGSKWHLVIPAELAYGEQGRPGIPPNSVLIFDVELLSIKEK
jgi:FKBP-type peptidyl-prolyl cis-trans isomerase FklB